MIQAHSIVQKHTGHGFEVVNLGHMTKPPGSPQKAS